MRPAINVGISVSRVGGSAQIKAMKEVAGSLRLDLAAFRELEAFAQLGTDLDAASQRQLDRGARMVELLKQGQYTPYEVIDQCISIFAGSKGVLDDIDLDKVVEFERGLLDHFHGPKKELRDKLDASRSFKGLEDEFLEAIREYKANWYVLIPVRKPSTQRAVGPPTALHSRSSSAGPSANQLRAGVPLRDEKPTPHPARFRTRPARAGSERR